MVSATHVLLRTNRRAAGFLLGAAVLPIVLGGLCLAYHWQRPSSIITLLGMILVVVGVFATFQLRRWWWLHRLTLDKDSLLVYLRRGKPWRIPLDAVEVFFMGQAPSTMRDQNGREVETRNVVVRLAERATTWQQQPGVESTLGRWCDGYITVYGVWCEPLNREVIDKMNRQLSEAKRNLRAAATSSGASRS